MDGIPRYRERLSKTRVGNKVAKQSGTAENYLRLFRAFFVVQKTVERRFLYIDEKGEMVWKTVKNT